MDKDKVAEKDNHSVRDMEKEMHAETWKPKDGKAKRKTNAKGGKCDEAPCLTVSLGAKAKRERYDSRGDVLELLEERAQTTSTTPSGTEEEICYPILIQFMSTLTDEQWTVIRRSMRKPGSKAQMSRIFQQIVRIISETAFQLLIPAILEVIEQQQQFEEESGSASQEKESAGRRPTKEDLIREYNYLKREVRKPGSGIHYYSRPASKASTKSSQDLIRKIQKVTIQDTLKTHFGVTEDSILNSLEATPISGSPDLTRAMVGEVLSQLNAGMSVVIAHSLSSGRSSPLTGCCQMVNNATKQLTKVISAGLQIFRAADDPVERTETPPLVQMSAAGSKANMDLEVLSCRSSHSNASEAVSEILKRCGISPFQSCIDMCSAFTPPPAALSLAEAQSAASLILESFVHDIEDVAEGIRLQDDSESRKIESTKEKVFAKTTGICVQMQARLKAVLAGNKEPRENIKVVKMVLFPGVNILEHSHSDEGMLDSHPLSDVEIEPCTKEVISTLLAAYKSEQIQPGGVSVVSGQISPVLSGQVSPVLSGQVSPVLSGQVSRVSPVLSGEVSPVLSGQISPVLTGQVTPVLTASLTEFMDQLISQLDEIITSSVGLTSHGASTCKTQEERTSDQRDTSSSHDLPCLRKLSSADFLAIANEIVAEVILKAQQTLTSTSPSSLLSTPIVSAPASPSPTPSFSQTTNERETLQTAMQSGVQFQLQPTISVGEVQRTSSAESGSLVSCQSSQHSLYSPTELESYSTPSSSSEKEKMLDEYVFSLPGSPTPSVVSIERRPIIRSTTIDMSIAPEKEESVSGTTQMILSDVASILMEHVDPVVLQQVTSPGSDPSTALVRLEGLVVQGSLRELSRDLVDRLQGLMSEQEYFLRSETVPAGKSVSDTFLSRCKTGGVQPSKLFTSELVYSFAEKSVNRLLVTLLLPPPSVDQGAFQDMTSPHISTPQSLSKSSSVASDSSLCVFNDTVSLLSKVLIHQVMDTLSLTLESRMELNQVTPQAEASGRQTSGNSFPSLSLAGSRRFQSTAGQGTDKDSSALSAGGPVSKTRSQVGMKKRFRSLCGLGKLKFSFKCKTDQKKDAQSPHSEEDQASIQKSYEQEQCLTAHIQDQQSGEECAPSTSQPGQAPTKHSRLTRMISAISTGLCMPFKKTTNQ